VELAAAVGPQHGALGTVGIGLVFGLVIMVMVYATGHLSGGRALVVGHSPTNEAAVLGLTGETVEAMSKGSGVLIVVDDEETRVEPLD
jgi:hypothetical protein